MAAYAIGFSRRSRCSVARSREVTCDPQFGIHRLVEQVKGRSSRVLRAEFPSLESRLPTLWTNSYFVATVGGATSAVAKCYVESQKNA